MNNSAGRRVYPKNRNSEDVFVATRGTTPLRMGLADANFVPPADSRRRGTTEHRSFRVAALVLCAYALATIPFFLAAFPPVMDFPNHLTRIWLLAGGAQIAPLSSIYEVRWWQASTNVGVDFVSTALAHALPLAAVAKILLLASFLAPPLGAVFLNRALFGRFDIWHLAGIALIWSTTAVTGLLSYQIGLAAALFCAVATRRIIAQLTPIGLLIIGALAAILITIHPFATLFFLLLATALILGERIPFPIPRAWLSDRLRRIAMVAAACLVPVAVLLVLSPHPPGDNGIHSHFVYWQRLKDILAPKDIPLLLMSPFLSYKVVLDLAAALPVFGVVIWAAFTRRLRVHAGLLAAAALLLLVTPALPMNLGDGGALPIRFPIMAALMALAGLRPAFPTPRSQATLAAVLISATALRVASIGWIWRERAKDAEDLYTVTEKLPPGAAVLVLQQKWGDKVPLGRLVAGFPGATCASERHFASLAVMWRHVFVPTMFTVPGQQPLGVKPDWRSRAVYASGVPFVEDIGLPSVQKSEPYVIDWRDKFDYVLVLDADYARSNLNGTRLVADHGFARLFQVVRSARAAARPPLPVRFSSLSQ